MYDLTLMISLFCLCLLSCASFCFLFFLWWWSLLLFFTGHLLHFFSSSFVEERARVCEINANFNPLLSRRKDLTSFIGLRAISVLSLTQLSPQASECDSFPCLHRAMPITLDWETPRYQASPSGHAQSSCRWSAGFFPWMISTASMPERDAGVWGSRIVCLA